MPSKISPGRFIRDAILKHLASHAFAPPPLPPIEETRWPACYGSSDETADIVSSSVPHCDYYQQTGFAVFHHCIFLILVDELVDKPATYFSALQVAIQCPEVLTALVKKIDEKLFEKIGTARVDGGFYQLVGVMWEINGHLTENVAKQLRPFLEPLLEAAGAAYTLYHTKPSARVTSNQGRAQGLSPDQQFIANMRAIQQTHPQTPPRLQEQFDVVLEAAGGLPASVFQLNTPRHPSQPGFEIYYGPLNFNVGLSPSAFDLNSEAVIRGEVLAEDLHDFDGHERGLDVAGARPDHSPRAQLQATELLKTLLTESAKAGEASPRSVSLALEDLMRTILDLSPPAVLRPEERSSTHIPMPRFSSHAPGHAARSSSLPPSPRTPVRGDLLESGFEYDVKKARMETPKNSGGGADGAALGTTRRLPFTPNNGRHAEN